MMEKYAKICKICEGKEGSPLTYLAKNTEGTPAQNTLRIKGRNYATRTSSESQPFSSPTPY
jgi:hypothetical protein